MRVDVPFEIHYLTPGAVPIEDVIDALLSAKSLIEEGGYNLGDLVPGLHIEQVSVTVRSITQESPLREMLFAAIYLTAQKDLEKEVPAMIELLSGTHVPENFKTIATLSVLIALFYGAAYVKDLVVHVTTDSKIKKQLNAMIKDLSDRTGQTEDQIRKFLDKRYKPKSKIKILGDAAFKFFKPSKSQANSPIRVNNREISQDLVSDIPQSYAYEQIMDEQSARPFPRVHLELTALRFLYQMRYAVGFYNHAMRGAIAERVADRIAVGQKAVR
jgi:hypothetical protein